ncbi:interleukin 15, like isoform X3 [Simochromis diagramma]|uniref:interleukin 15, like isoform X3 n=1 Tax=Simochromis diagramma TaxID=43689 RepID=UPI001A7ED6BA|nr:interleukin 15, like isoform X3 [Simochromis diagramma]
MQLKAEPASALEELLASGASGLRGSHRALSLQHTLSLNCSLYTPTMEDYEQICPRTTMQCFASEIIVLTHEWELEPKWKKLNRLLSRLASRINQTASKCRRCEVMKEENATTFLENLLWTVEKSNSDYC